MEYNRELIATRISDRRNELDMSLELLGDKVGVAKSTIQRYEKAKIRNPKLAVLESIAKNLGVSTEWLLGKTQIQNPISSVFGIRDVGLQTLPNFATNSNQRLCTNTFFTVADNSMFPEIHSGDVLSIIEGTIPKSGEIHLVSIDSAPCIVRRVEEHGDYLILIPTNPDYPTLEFSNKEKSRVRFVGSIKSLFRNYI